MNIEEFVDLVFLIIVLQTLSEEDDLSPNSFIAIILQELSTYFRIFISPTPYSSCLLVQPVCPGTELGPAAVIIERVYAARLFCTIAHSLRV